MTVYRWTQQGYLVVAVASEGEVRRGEPFAEVEIVVADLFAEE